VKRTASGDPPHGQWYGSRDRPGRSHYCSRPLREHLHLNGVKRGCDHGTCGACTVLIDCRRVLSCLTLAAACDGADVTTIEGLARDGELHPLQAAFIEHVVSGVACIAEGHTGSVEETREWMSGNICRCGAYLGIIAAIDSVARRLQP
jgi:xanthine dehydrogenase YagT iron-sulfur-binding subunit